MQHIDDQAIDMENPPKSLRDCAPKLVLRDIHFPVKKLVLKNLPNQYTYKLYFLHLPVGYSKLINNFQTFDFETMKTEVHPDILMDLNFWINTSHKGSDSQFLTENERENYIEFNRISHIYIDGDDFHLHDEKFLQDVFEIEVFGLTHDINHQGRKNNYHKIHRYDLNKTKE